MDGDIMSNDPKYTSLYNHRSAGELPLISNMQFKHIIELIEQHSLTLDQIDFIIQKLETKKIAP